MQFVIELKSLVAKYEQLLNQQTRHCARQDIVQYLHRIAECLQLARFDRVEAIVHVL